MRIPLSSLWLVVICPGGLLFQDLSLGLSSLAGWKNFGLVLFVPIGSNCPLPSTFIRGPAYPFPGVRNLSVHFCAQRWVDEHSPQIQWWILCFFTFFSDQRVLCALFRSQNRTLFLAPRLSSWLQNAASWAISMVGMVIFVACKTTLLVPNCSHAGIASARLHRHKLSRDVLPARVGLLQCIRKAHRLD